MTPTPGGPEETTGPGGEETTTEFVTPGGTVTTDDSGDGATPSDPVETYLTSPNAGTVTIEETRATATPPSGYEFFGQQVNISAPAATAADPLTITFLLDASLIAGVDPETVEVFRNAAIITACTDATGTASPDPCRSRRVLRADGDLELTVLTSAASAWNFGRPQPGGGPPLPNTSDPDNASSMLTVIVAVTIFAGSVASLAAAHYAPRNRRRSLRGPRG